MFQVNSFLNNNIRNSCKSKGAKQQLLILLPGMYLAQGLDATANPYFKGTGTLLGFFW